MIYFVQSVAGGPIKIGYCSEDKLDQRLKALQCGSPFILVVTKTIPKATRDMERRMHQIFRPERLHGEWFYPSPLLAGLADAKGNEDLEDLALETANMILERRGA